MTIQKLWTTKELTELGLGTRVTLWKRVREGTFPRPVKLSGKVNNHNVWLDEDIKDYFRKLSSKYG